MPDKVYVAGPVVSEKESLPPLYRVIVEEAQEQGRQVELPVRHPQVDNFPPTQFTEWTASRIRSAAAVVAVLPREDQSVPVESTLAAVASVPQLVVADAPGSVPRLVEGLPGVTAVIDAGDEEAVRAGVRTLLARTKGSPPPLASA
jgi:hypothetical protein